jgi:putative transposase
MALHRSGENDTEHLRQIARLSDELLNETLFRSLPHARAALDAWRSDHNHDRPHSRLAWLSPATYAAQRRSAALRRLRSADRRHNRPTGHH